MKKNIVRRKMPIASALQKSNWHPVIQQICANRFIEFPDQMDLSLSRLLAYHDLKDINRAAEILCDALQNQKRILIIGDYDVDGAVSTALMIRVLTALGAKQVDFLIPNRFIHGYGLTKELFLLALEKKPDLIVTVDNGIASVEAVKLANEQGIQVLITDHHAAGDELPEAVAIVNPNQSNDLFASKNLAGVGVAFYVLSALRAKLREIHWFEKNNLMECQLADYLDLIALGTVADVVNFDHNNRILVYQGLQRIRAGKCCVGIQALLQTAGRFCARTTVHDLGFVVGPRLNASGRLEDMTLSVRCLLTDDLEEARGLALQLDRMNRERRDIEDQMQTQALSILASLEIQENLPMGICLMNENWHEGVSGIVASRVKDRLHRPVVVFTHRNENKNQLKGSARSIPELHLHELLSFINEKNPGLIIRFGGHAMAAGLSIPKENYEKFAEIFNQAIQTRLKEVDLKPKIISDGELSKEDFRLELIGLIQSLGPWGPTFEEPLFDGEFRLINQYLVGKKHLKLILDYQGRIVEGIAFYVDTDLWPNDQCQKIRLVYRLGINDYQDQKKIQLVVKHLEPITVLEENYD